MKNALYFGDNPYFLRELTEDDQPKPHVVHHQIH